MRRWKRAGQGLVGKKMRQGEMDGIKRGTGDKDYEE